MNMTQLNINSAKKTRVARSGAGSAAEEASGPAGAAAEGDLSLPGQERPKPSLFLMKFAIAKADSFNSSPTSWLQWRLIPHKIGPKSALT